MTTTVHLAVYDTLADWEPGYAIAHITRDSWQRAPGRYDVRTVAGSLDPVTTAGGIRVLPDTTLDDIEPGASAMLILSGNDIWNTAAFEPFAAKAREFLEAGTPVAAICGATAGLAMHGLLDDRDHTSNAREFLAGTGYAGGERYRDEPAVTDGPLITASGVRPVEFAAAIFDMLGLYEPSTLASWQKLYGAHDAAGFYELMAIS
jgi:putative intracellular protease/amidase